MKKIILPLFLVLAFKSKSQIIKNYVFIGGSVQSSKTTEEFGTDKKVYSNNNVSPRIDWGFKNNALFGFYINLNNRNEKIYENNVLEYTNVSKSYGVGFAYRNYIPIAKKLYYFTELTAEINFGKSTSQSFLNIPTKQKLNSFGFYITPGISYSITKRLNLELMFSNALGYTYISRKALVSGNSSILPNKTTTSSFIYNLNPGSNITLGFRYRVKP